MGGVARRATSLRELRTKNASVPVLVVDTGNATRQTDVLDDPVNRWVVEAFDALGTHAVNVSTADLRRWNRLAQKDRMPKAVSAGYLATALETLPAARFALKPWAVQTVRSRSGDAEVRVGILAVSEPAAEEGLVKAYDPIEALKFHLPTVDAQSDVVVLLARASDQELFRIASMFPAIDVIVNGSPTGEGRDLGKVSNAVIVESAHEGVAMGVLRIDFDAKSRVTKYENQQVPLPPVVPDSQALADLVDRARREVSAFAEEEARKSPAPSGPSAFAGSRACADCHEKAYQVWEKSAHAKAIAVLAKSGNQFNKECVQCHVTGFGVQRGFVNMIATPQLANVQCEACHDTALDHSRSPMTTHPGVGLMQQMRRKVRKDFCLRCHTPENSPKFDYDSYWAKIAH